MSSDTSKYALPPNERLRSLGAIKLLFTQGQSGFIYPFRYIYRKTTPETSRDAGVEVLFSVPKKFHRRANKRNLLRRRMKEAYRLQKTIINELAEVQNLDVALVYSTRDLHTYKTISNAIRKILEHIAQGA